LVNVCVVNPNYFRSSGITVSIRRIYESLPKGEITQFFVDCGYGEESAETSWIPRGRFATFHLMTLNPFALLRACKLFSSWLKHNDIRVVHVHHRRLAVILNVLKLIRGYKLIYTGNLTYPFEFWFWLLSPRIATGVTQSVIENMRRTSRAKEFHLISNGCDFPAECPAVDVARVASTAICIGRLEPVKAHSILLDAWKMLLDHGRQCRLLLVGEGSLRDSLREQAKALGIDHMVEFRGFQKNVLALVDEALFAVLPSQVEGQAIVTIESATIGRASLVTDVDGSRDCVPPTHALPNLIKFGDTAGLANALEAWFARPDLAVVEGRVFFDYLKRSSSSAFVASQYQSLYRQVAAS
jgi:glycosyltransferase involved in cell wall biosynthesis